MRLKTPRKLTRRGREGHAAAAALAVGAALLAHPPSARADAATFVNALRTASCNRSTKDTAMRPNAALDAAARNLSRKARLREAVESADYAAAASASFHVKGPTSGNAVLRELTSRYCAAIREVRYAEIGGYARGDEVWIVLATPQPKPKPLMLVPAKAAARVLELVNEARAAGRKCGRERFAAAPPLTASAELAAAALAHARDMAEHTTLTHRGSDGSQSSDRITRAGYAWRWSGENVASGQQDADTVVAGWLDSPGHCANIMQPNFTQMGVAFALAPGQNPGIYWAQEFGAPQR
jgi:uncharacterized protein YkwD